MSTGQRWKTAGIYEVKVQNLAPATDGPKARGHSNACVWSSPGGGTSGTAVVASASQTSGVGIPAGHHIELRYTHTCIS